LPRFCGPMARIERLERGDNATRGVAVPKEHRARLGAIQPASTVSVHSVSLRRVMHGTPDRYASFWTPPESVAMACAWSSRATIAR
jgi:hypothetical protein